jgi:hypothetical protein
MDSQGRGIALDKLDFNLTSRYLTRHCDGLMGGNGPGRVNECPAKMTKRASVDRPRRRAIFKKMLRFRLAGWIFHFCVLCAKKSIDFLHSPNVYIRITPQGSHIPLIVFSTTVISTYHCLLLGIEFVPRNVGATITKMDLQNLLVNSSSNAIPPTDPSNGPIAKSFRRKRHSDTPNLKFNRKDPTSPVIGAACQKKGTRKVGS